MFPLRPCSHCRGRGQLTTMSKSPGFPNTINALSTTMSASYNDKQLTLTYVGASAPGAHGNLIGAYASVSGAQTESWSPASQYFSGGLSPSKWGVSLNFGSLTGFLTSTPGPSDSQVTV